MTWLVSGGRVLAFAETAETRSERRRGLRGRDGIDGAFVIPKCRWVHTIGMRFAIEVVYLGADGTVVKVDRLPPQRVGLPVWSGRTAVECADGATERWGLKVGDVVELRE